MKKSPLSRESLDMLHDNGYSLKRKENVLTIKRTPDNMALVVLLIIMMFVSIPIFAFGTVYGVIFLGLVLGVVFVRRFYFSKKSQLSINSDNNTFTVIVDNYHMEDLPLKVISTISIDSRFLGEYTSASRSHQEEHLITIRIELMTKEVIPLFRIKSDHAEPSDEVNEVYNFLEETVKGAKAA